MAFRALGVAADVYLGKADGGKYKQPPVGVVGETGLANLFHVLTGALKEGLLTPKEYADAALGLDTFLEKHTDKDVTDYTAGVRSKLDKKRNPPKGKAAPAQPLGTPVTIKGEPAPPPPEDVEVIDDAKVKADLLDDIGRIADRADEPDQPEIF